MDHVIKIKSIYRDIGKKERELADYILEHGEAIIHLSIRELATKANVAESTIFRFTQKLGYSGFKAFKLGLATDISTYKQTESIFYQPISDGDDYKTVADKVLEANANSLRDTSELISNQELERALQILEQSDRLFFYGIGGSSAVAVDAYHKFLRSPIEVSCDVDSHIQLMRAARMNSNDCAIIISHSGQSHQIQVIAEEAKRNGSKIIVITSFMLSPLAEIADVCFLSISTEAKYMPEALASRISQLSIIDALFVNFTNINKAVTEKHTKQIRDVIRLTKE